MDFAKYLQLLEQSVEKQNSEKILLSSATPMLNNPLELLSLINELMPMEQSSQTQQAFNKTSNVESKMQVNLSMYDKLLLSVGFDKSSVDMEAFKSFCDIMTFHSINDFKDFMIGADIYSGIELNKYLKYSEIFRSNKQLNSNKQHDRTQIQNVGSGFHVSSNGTKDNQVQRQSSAPKESQINNQVQQQSKDITFTVIKSDLFEPNIQKSVPQKKEEVQKQSCSQYLPVGYIIAKPLPENKVVISQALKEPELSDEELNNFMKANNIYDGFQLNAFMHNNNFNSLAELKTYVQKQNNMLKAPVKQPKKTIIEKDDNVKKNLLSKLNESTQCSILEDYSSSFLSSSFSIPVEIIKSQKNDQSNINSSFLSGNNSNQDKTKSINSLSTHNQNNTNLKSEIKITRNVSNPRNTSQITNKKYIDGIFHENKSKSLFLYDNQGIWKISNDSGYKQLTRYHNHLAEEAIDSYWSTLTGDVFTFYMINGHKFVFSYNGSKFGIGTTARSVVYYDNHVWK